MESMGSMTMATATTSTSSAMSTGMSGMSGMGMGGMDSNCKISMLWNWNTIDACFLSSSWHIRSRGMFAGSCIGVICLVLCLEFLRRVGREYDAFIVRRARLRRLYLSGSAPAGVSSSQQPFASIPPQKDTPAEEGGSGAQNGGDRGGNVSSASSVFKDDLITPAVDSPSAAQPQNRVPAPRAAPWAPSAGTGLSPRAEPDAVAAGPTRPSPVEQIVRALLHMLQFAVAYFIMLLAMYFNGYIIICIFIGAFLGSLIFSWEPVGLGPANDATQVTKCCG